MVPTWAVVQIETVLGLDPCMVLFPAETLNMARIARKDGRGHLLPDSRVYTMLGVSRSTFYRLLEKGVITPPLAKLGKNRRGWTLADIGLAKQEIEGAKEAR